MPTLTETFSGPLLTTNNPWVSHLGSSPSAISMVIDGVDASADVEIVPDAGFSADQTTIYLPVAALNSSLPQAQFTLTVRFRLTSGPGPSGLTIRLASVAQLIADGFDAYSDTNTIEANFATTGHPAYFVGPSVYFIDSSITCDTAWHTMIITCDGAGNVGFQYDSGTLHTLSDGTWIEPLTDNAIIIQSEWNTGSIAAANHIDNIDLVTPSLTPTVTFVDPSGNPIANGTMVVCLSSDSHSSGGQVISRNFTVSLDANGTADLSSIFVLSGLTNNFGVVNAPSYSVTVYSAEGELVFGPSRPNDPILPSPLQ